MKPIVKRTLKKVGRYEVENQIGHGGFASVYLGKDPYIKRFVALKISELGNESKQQKVLERLFKEAEAAGALIHPNIVTIYDVGIETDICYIAMEYIEGNTLYQNCLPSHKLPIVDSLDIIIKVLHGLDYAHQRGVIHRDVKPSNVLLGNHGEIKIADFGLACFAELASQDTRPLGTPSYMPPEQIEGKGSTPASDLFSVGIILYRLLTGEKPFDADDPEEMRQKIVNEPHIPLIAKNSELPSILGSIVDRALMKDPASRYQNGFEFARDLEKVLQSPGQNISNTLVERINNLRPLHFFEEFDNEEIASLLSIGTWLTYDSGDIIVAEGSSGSGFFVIADGEIAVKISGVQKAKMGRGNCFGEMAFLLNRQRSATVEALKPCNLLQLNPEKISVLPDKAQIKLYKIFSKSLAGHLVRAQGK